MHKYRIVIPLTDFGKISDTVDFFTREIGSGNEIANMNFATLECVSVLESEKLIDIDAVIKKFRAAFPTLSVKITLE